MCHLGNSKKGQNGKQTQTEVNSRSLLFNGLKQTTLKINKSQQGVDSGLVSFVTLRFRKSRIIKPFFF